MKSLAKSFLRAAVARLPAGAQEAALDEIATSLGPWHVVQKVAAKCGVATLGVSGAYGRMLSSISDAEVLRTYARTGRFAERTNRLLCEFFAGRSGYFVDVGANIGLTTVPVAQNPGVRCVAIEPDPTNFANLTANVAANCLWDNVELRQLAIFARRSVLRLELSPENAGDNRLRLNNTAGLMSEEHWPIVEVDAAPLDDVITHSCRPLAVKLDVQGAEPFVFESGARTLAAADLIITEWAPYWLTRVGGEATTVTSFLCRNFDQLIIAEGEEGQLLAPEPAPIVVERLLEMLSAYRNDPRHYMDVIARR